MVCILTCSPPVHREDTKYEKNSQTTLCVLMEARRGRRRRRRRKINKTITSHFPTFSPLEPWRCFGSAEPVWRLWLLARVASPGRARAGPTPPRLLPPASLARSLPPLVGPVCTVQCRQRLTQTASVDITFVFETPNNSHHSSTCPGSGLS